MNLQTDKRRTHLVMNYINGGLWHNKKEKKGKGLKQDPKTKRLF